MALLPPTGAPEERRPSPGLTLNLSSNNPFRNRANSPSLASPASLPTPTTQSARPVSRNPFLADFEAANNDPANNRSMATVDTVRSTSPQKASFGSNAQELFDNLTLDEKYPQNGPLNPPKRSDTLPTSNHRPRRSDEDRPRGDGGRRPSRPRVLLSNDDPFASPERRERREYSGPGPRPRRTNSESSAHRPMTEEEKKARDQRRRDRERRYRERSERDRDGKPRERRSSRPRKPNAGLDLIDRLDVTGIYGPGLIHHDGPFDACNPHRNRRKDYRAPMQAFPTDSKNNTIGGTGPVNKNLDLDRIRGVGAEGYEDYANAATADGPGRKWSFEKERGPGYYDPFAKTELQHGEETVGLGTSTFLEGTQASRSAMQRRESDNETSTYANGAGPAGGGLGRKKSLAQRIRGMSQTKRGGWDGAPNGPISPRDPTSPDSPPRKGSVTTSVRPVYPASAGGRIGVSQVGDKNPFFNDYDDAYEKKGASIKIAEQENGVGMKEKPVQRARAPSSPRRDGYPLQRSMTGDGQDGLTRTTTNGGGPPAPVSGFLNRVKSLKGRKKV